MTYLLIDWILNWIIIKTFEMDNKWNYIVLDQKSLYSSLIFWINKNFMKNRLLTKRKINRNVNDSLVESIMKNIGETLNEAIMRIIPKDNVKNWYVQTYPQDDLGQELHPYLTFTELWKYMRMGVNAYTLIAVEDSLVRERIFEELSKRLQTPYDAVYNVWLHKKVEFNDDDYVPTEY